MGDAKPRAGAGRARRDRKGPTARSRDRRACAPRTDRAGRDGHHASLARRRRCCVPVARALDRGAGLLARHVALRSVHDAAARKPAVRGAHAARARGDGGVRVLLPAAAALLVTAAATGCISFTGPASALHPIRRDSTPTWRACSTADRCTSDVRFTYLGVGGFLIRAGSEAVMTAPSFTHPGWLSVVTPLWPMHSDSAAVDHELRRFLGADLGALDGVHSILVGHAHYDHLLDVPLIARRYIPRATIYGSLTTKRILMGDSSMRARAGRIDSLSPADSVIATPWRVGRWMYSPSRRMRFMAMQSGHAPNWWIITIAPCHAKRDRASLPRTAWGWCRGEPVSYLIDLLDESG